MYQLPVNFPGLLSPLLSMPLCWALHRPPHTTPLRSPPITTPASNPPITCGCLPPVPCFVGLTRRPVSCLCILVCPLPPIHTHAAPLSPTCHRSCPALAAVAVPVRRVKPAARVPLNEDGDITFHWDPSDENADPSSQFPFGT
jgi:hypothetical protein